jgi:hypothetical protein
MAGNDGIGIGGYFDTQGTTRAMRSSRHIPLSLVQVQRDYRGRLSERPLTGRWSALLMVVHAGRQTKPWMHRFLKY